MTKTETQILADIARYGYCCATTARGKGVRLYDTAWKMVEKGLVKVVAKDVERDTRRGKTTVFCTLVVK